MFRFGRYQPTKGHKAILVLALIADCALLVSTDAPMSIQ